MSVKEMDSLQTSSSESDIKKVLKSDGCETTLFRNNSHSARILEDLQSLRKNEVLCDIRFETDDGCITFGHKNVLMAASSYFSSMFSNYFEESNKDIVKVVAAVAFLVQKGVHQKKKKKIGEPRPPAPPQFEHVVGHSTRLMNHKFL